MIFIFVPTTTAKRISFLNHMNKKIVGGIHNALSHYVDASAPHPYGVVLCNHFKWDILWFISGQKSCCYLCAYHISKMNIFCNHMDKKIVGGKHNVLVHYVDVSASNPSGVVLCIPFKWDVLCSFLIKNHLVVFVPSTTVKWISFCNHSNRKVVGGKHNVLLLYVEAKFTVLLSSWIGDKAIAKSHRMRNSFNK